MRFPNRAGGVAAAMLFLLLGTFNPTPSLALQIDLPKSATPLAASAIPEAPVDQITPASPAADAASTEAPRIPQLRAIDPPQRSLAETVEAYAAGTAADGEQECLANAVYFEAKGEPLRGQLAVAQVILNRTRSGRFPSSVCGVVRQRGQFSFVHRGHLPSVPRGSAAWRKAVAVARMAREGAEPVAARALFFHARSVSTGWHAVRVAQIGNHIFYR
ncbi:MAG: cell wall hydrolase [Alphaproteobacteria bacterium]|nr:cell wall hydrolase [Alphaproteobacteria bacterium]